MHITSVNNDKGIIQDSKLLLDNMEGWKWNRFYICHITIADINAKAFKTILAYHGSFWYLVPNIFI